MPSPPKPSAQQSAALTPFHTTTITHRVRYMECDPMGFVHHSHYVGWFENARVELLRETGTPYADLENEGTLIVVSQLQVSYLSPGRYDDIVQISAHLLRAQGARIEHMYEVHRGDTCLTRATTTLACLDRSGRVLPVPEKLRTPKR